MDGESDEDYELMTLRSWSSKALKKELKSYGVEMRGAYEKDELVQLVHEAQASRSKRKRNASDSSRRSPSARSNSASRANSYANNGCSTPSGHDRGGHPGSPHSSSQDHGSEDRPGGTRRSPKAEEPSGEAPPPQSPQSSTGMTREAALECLGLPAGEQLTAAELRRAYKAAAMRWHPDRQRNHTKKEEATRRFQDVRAAYELLQAATLS